MFSFFRWSFSTPGFLTVCWSAEALGGSVSTRTFWRVPWRKAAQPVVRVGRRSVGRSRIIVLLDSTLRSERPARVADVLRARRTHPTWVGRRGKVFEISWDFSGICFGIRRGAGGEAASLTVIVDSWNRAPDRVPSVVPAGPSVVPRGA